MPDLGVVPVLAGLALNAGAGVWWADPLAALVIVFYALLGSPARRGSCGAASA